MKKYEYQTVQVFPGEQGFNIEAPSFKAHTPATLNEVLISIPNMMQEEEHGSWEHYNTLFIGSTIVFFIRRPQSQILVPKGVG